MIFYHGCKSQAIRSQAACCSLSPWWEQCFTAVFASAQLMYTSRLLGISASKSFWWSGNLECLQTLSWVLPWHISQLQRSAADLLVKCNDRMAKINPPAPPSARAGSNQHFKPSHCLNDSSSPSTPTSMICLIPSNQVGPAICGP